MQFSRFGHISEVFTQAMREALSPPVGLSTPWWPMFEKYMGGIRPNELTLICAPTGSGKTQFLANLSAQLVNQNIPHFAAPVETGNTDFVLRTISALEIKDLNDGKAIPEAQSKRIIFTYLEKLKKTDVYISSYDNRVEVESMIQDLEFMHQEHKCQVAILDNLNFFLKVTSTQMEKAEMDNAIHEFVIAAKKLPMHIFLVCHPRKTDEGRVESEFDIKGSSTAVQECSNVMLFNRPKKKDVESGARCREDRELVFKKLRKRGMYVNYPIWFGYQSGRYREIV